MCVYGEAGAAQHQTFDLAQEEERPPRHSRGGESRPPRPSSRRVRRKPPPAPPAAPLEMAAVARKRGPSNNASANAATKALPVATTTTAGRKRSASDAHAEGHAPRRVSVAKTAGRELSLRGWRRCVETALKRTDGGGAVVNVVLARRRDVLVHNGRTIERAATDHPHQVSGRRQAAPRVAARRRRRRRRRRREGVARGARACGARARERARGPHLCLAHAAGESSSAAPRTPCGPAPGASGDAAHRSKNVASPSAQPSSGV